MYLLANLRLKQIKFCETLRENDNQIFHAESRKSKNAKFRKEV